MCRREVFVINQREVISAPLEERNSQTIALISDVYIFFKSMNNYKWFLVQVILGLWIIKLIV